ncbi:MAG: flavodoxin [Lachnospiraceae bacterium]|nr:flavodoxin [Lachnospiraceae bacterium]
MKIAVRYQSRSGNTRKIADAIANSVGVTPMDISVPLGEDVDILFLGGGVYAGKCDESVEKFLRSLRVKVGMVYCFSTSSTYSTILGPVKKICEARGIPISDQEFHCPGSFLLLHRGRPNQEDLRKADIFGTNCKVWAAVATESES